ncbi:unnamed protein product [Urochloa humidicola]
MAPPPPPPPMDTLMDELIEEALLRLPPEEPAVLVRAALVCRRWRRLISGPGFRRRFRELHRAPPMLGFFGNPSGTQGAEVALFVPTRSSFPSPPRADRRGLRALDARHGRVLLYATPRGANDPLVVWDPVTDEQRYLPAVPQWRPQAPGACTWSWSAAVLCAASAGGGCDHLDCRRGPFLVVYVGTTRTRTSVGTTHNSTSVHVYSSDAGAWSLATIAHQLPSEFSVMVMEPSVLVGDALYFRCCLGMSIRILEYNMATREVSVIPFRLPPESYNWQRTVLMASEDGKLGYAIVHMSRLCLWFREIGTNGDVAWAQTRVIDLDALLPVDALVSESHVAAVADGEVVFLRTAVGIFIVNLKSGQIKNLGEDHDYYDIVPYTSFCTPGMAFT